MYNNVRITYNKECKEKRATMQKLHIKEKNNKQQRIY